ncbi:geranylgeranylglyceryl/heptaprenylglyceryl phosphate synthase [Lacinutrix sp. Bg11-31]|uniref:geranylgeranylglyceryl/heptaprenylglyceryl phosphate synthase n=1 Tax=Lacinutrix sp. Bg11-31 TaxID=2057808 RepID=UPI000C300625|nr:geranylgeranylglyceryl/heptaprenylglyceryl phosphate synthase [Lacinutrix sp. Bg11-31]AUC83176.1 geranylgeranylglyceryl/heptaprenylglyceryl phosphate synthase [Lacinutrix sp. Bg11-31]
MKSILQHIKTSEKRNLAVLVDPDKFNLEKTSQFIDKVNNSIATHIFIGGSIVDENATETLISVIKPLTGLPIVLFPGDVIQVSEQADAILFLSLVSGRNPEYLIGQQVKSVSKLRNSNLEIIPTGYVLVDGKKETSTQKVTNTEPLTKLQEIVDTAKASELLGMQLIYLEAGSGAKQAVSSEIINAVKIEIKIPLIVGGGIRSKLAIEKAFNAGANVVVIGTAFEEDESFFEEIKR